MKLVRTLLLVVLSWVGGVAAGEVGVTDKSILIGMTAPFSGPSGPYGLDMKMVINAYFRQLNDAGGVHGRRLDLRSLDDGYETERTVANTRALIAQEQVFALLGFYGSSPTTAAMNEVFGVAKVPLVGTISGADSLRQSPRDHPNNRYMFNVRASYANETEAIVNQLVSLGFKSIAVFYQNDGFGKSGLEGVLAALRKHNQVPSAVATVERNSADVSGAVQTIAKANPQAVIMVTLYKASAAFVREMRKAKQNPQFMTLSPVGRRPAGGGTGRARRVASAFRRSCPTRGTTRCRSCASTRSCSASRDKRRTSASKPTPWRRCSSTRLRKAGKEPDSRKTRRSAGRHAEPRPRAVIASATRPMTGWFAFCRLTVIGSGGRILR
jgi:hypothetical protein